MLRRWPAVYGECKLARVRIVHDHFSLRVPGPMAANLAHWPARVAKHFDAHALAADACALHTHIAPGVNVATGDPEVTSYALIAAMDLPWARQYQLFCAPTTVMRLRSVRCAPL